MTSASLATLIASPISWCEFSSTSNLLEPYIFIESRQLFATPDQSKKFRFMSGDKSNFPPTSSQIIQPLKPLLKKTSTFLEKTEHTGRKLSFSDENGGNLAKYYEIQNIATTSSKACIIS